MAAAKIRQPIQGILHASGVLHDALIRQQSPALVREVYAAKVAGCQALLMVSFRLRLANSCFCFLHAEQHGVVKRECRTTTAEIALRCAGRQLSAGRQGSAFQQHCSADWASGLCQLRSSQCNA